MESFLERLRNKPTAVRRAITLVVAVTLFVIVLGLWAMLDPRGAKTVELAHGDKNPRPEAQKDNTGIAPTSPFETVMRGYNELKQQMASFRVELEDKAHELEQTEKKDAHSKRTNAASADTFQIGAGTFSRAVITPDASTTATTTKATATTTEVMQTDAATGTHPYE